MVCPNLRKSFDCWLGKPLTSVEPWKWFFHHLQPGQTSAHDPILGQDKILNLAGRTCHQRGPQRPGVQGSGLVHQVYGINVRRSCFAYDMICRWFMCGLRMFMYGLCVVYVYIYIDPVTLHNRRIRYGLVTDFVMVEPTVQKIGINRRHFAKLEYWKTHCHVRGWKRSLNVSGMSMQSIPPSSINSHQRKESHFRKYQPNTTKHQLAHACKPSTNSGFYLCEWGW